MTNAGAPTVAPRPYAVLGATGEQGGATARTLLAAGARVDALVRDPTSTRARALADDGCRLAQADLDEDGGLPEALAGTQGVFAVTTFDGPGGPRGGSRAGPMHRPRGRRALCSYPPSWP
ncbi:NmrA family NAD(P)-binding protein [Pseudokineococcus sp. 1T1Z-3]|uniref:NmrA family NAD(P)-binding protein n=1 Tax=Pseudokineococcus sp. 1T1Z-3 TaxID=3132745 RepID=UPI0030B20D45